MSVLKLTQCRKYGVPVYTNDAVCIEYLRHYASFKFGKRVVTLIVNTFHCNSSELFRLSFKIVFRCLSIWIGGPDKRIDINIFKYRDCCLCRLVAMVGGEWTDTADSSKADWSFYRYYGRLIYRYGPLIGISTSSVLICVCCVLMTSYTMHVRTALLRTQQCKMQYVRI